MDDTLGRHLWTFAPYPQQRVAEPFRPLRGRHYHMSQTRGATLASGLVVLFLLSLVPSTHYAPLESATESVRNEVTPIGQNQQLTIGSWPDGANQRVELSIPDGHSIKSLNIDLGASTLTSSMGSVLTDAGDFSGGAQYLSLIHI